MKKKVSKIWGVGLAVTLVASLMLAVVPVSAGTLGWGADTTFAVPTTTNNILVPEAHIDILDMAVSGDGATIYVATGDTVTDDSKNLFKSTDSGATWSQVDTHADVDTTITGVAVAPDDADLVAIIADDKEVYISTGGGTSWSTLGEVVEASLGPALHLYDIAISPAKSGVNYIAVAGDETSNVGNLWYWDKGAAAPSWTETNDFGDDFQAVDAFMAVEFSPNFASDQTMVAVGGPKNSSGSNTTVYFQIFSYSADEWNDTAGFADYPVTVDTFTANSIIESASIALPSTFLGADDTERLAFVAYSTDEDAVEGRLVRLTDTSVKELKDAIGFRSVAYNTDLTKLVAGAYETNQVYRCVDPLASSPTVSSASTNKRPADNTDSSKPVVAWVGDTVVAVTDGDESAFSVSNDDGKTFNDISLIDTVLTYIRDMAVSADGSVVYFISDDGTNLSVWRKASRWERVLAIKDAEYLIRLAPGNADVAYVFDTNSTKLYYTNDGGMTKWWMRYCEVTPVDIAVESDEVAYAVNSSGNVSKTTNAGFIWASAKATGLGSGHSIISLSEDNLIATSTDGYVAYSTEGNASASGWTKINSQVNSSGSDVEVAATGLADGDFIYAASQAAGQNIRRWEIGTSTSWSDIISGTVAEKVFGLMLQDGVLYAMACDDEDSALYRCLSPSSAGSTTGWSSKASTDADDITLNRQPQAMKVSTGSTIKLWAIEVDKNKIYSFSDTLALEAPTLIGPADGAAIGVNPVTGRTFDISFSWSRLSTSTKYDLEVALDDGFGERPVAEDVSSTSSTVDWQVGPYGADKLFEWMPDTTYYWRVRTDVAGPLFSQYSEVRSFTTGEALEPVPPVEIVIPPAPPAPTLTVEIPPAPDIIVTVPATPAAATITPGWIYAIVIIGAVLVIALIVLIIRTRRVA